MRTQNTAVGLAAFATLLVGFPAQGQSRSGLALSDAIAMAHSVSPELRAANEAVAAARGRELQARAISNPSLAYSTERTSGNGASNSQQIFGLEQRLEVGGQRGARARAAALRRTAAEARRESARTLLDYEVARTYALAVSADRRASLARQAAASFSTAGRVSARRLAAGDVSVYADRRLRLEAARYSALEAEANLSRRSARLALSALISASADSFVIANAILTDSIPSSVTRLDVTALRAAALRGRADYVAAAAEIEALEAEVTLASRERVPTPLLSAGVKTETAGQEGDRMSGFAGGISLPLPLFDRRKGAVQAAAAEVRRAAAEREVLKRRIVREVDEAADALIAAEQQRAALAPQLGSQSSAALRSAQVAYAEGEITLLEWLDAVRAYHEAESSYANLLAETAIRRATLERVVGGTRSGADR